MKGKAADKLQCRTVNAVRVVFNDNRDIHIHMYATVPLHVLRTSD
jgi:hypothetical protein